MRALNDPFMVALAVLVVMSPFAIMNWIQTNDTIIESIASAIGPALLVGIIVAVGYSLWQMPWPWK